LLNSFSEDVYSFAMVMWESWRCQKPFDEFCGTLTLSELRKHIKVFIQLLSFFLSFIEFPLGRPSTLATAYKRRRLVDDWILPACAGMLEC